MLTSAYYKYRLAEMSYGSQNTNSFTVKNFAGNTVTAQNASLYVIKPARMSTSGSQEQESSVRWGSLYNLNSDTTSFAGTQSFVSATIANGGGTFIGDGDTPPTIDDYCLSGNRITDFTATTAVNLSIVNGKGVIQATYTIQNIGASTFTIREICGCKCLAGDLSQSPIMWFRTVLENPVTIEPGNSGIVTITMRLD